MLVRFAVIVLSCFIGVCIFRKPQLQNAFFILLGLGKASFICATERCKNAERTINRKVSAMIC